MRFVDFSVIFFVVFISEIHWDYNICKKASKLFRLISMLVYFRAHFIHRLTRNCFHLSFYYTEIEQPKICTQYTLYSKRYIHIIIVFRYKFIEMCLLENIICIYDLMYILCWTNWLWKILERMRLQRMKSLESFSFGMQYFQNGTHWNAHKYD